MTNEARVIDFASALESRPETDIFNTQPNIEGIGPHAVYTAMADSLSTHSLGVIDGGVDDNAHIDRPDYETLDIDFDLNSFTGNGLFAPSHESRLRNLIGFVRHAQEESGATEIDLRINVSERLEEAKKGIHKKVQPPGHSGSWPESSEFFDEETLVYKFLNYLRGMNHPIAQALDIFRAQTYHLLNEAQRDALIHDALLVIGYSDAPKELQEKLDTETDVPHNGLGSRPLGVVVKQIVELEFSEMRENQ